MAGMHRIITIAAAFALIWAVTLAGDSPMAVQQTGPPGAPLPPSGGGRGPNPMTGLVGLVDTPTAGPDAPRFEVASVKRNKTGANGATDLRGLAGGQVRMTNATLRMMIRSAYRLTLTDEIVDGPAWLDTDGFDVDAKPAMPVTLLESSYMMRTLLADRFQLVVRKEAREKPIYALVLARRDGSLGSQIKRPAGECVMAAPAFARPAGSADSTTGVVKPGASPVPGQAGRRCGIGPEGGAVKAGSVTMTALVGFLTPLMDRPVVDRTGLTGTFDFDLRYDGASTPGLGRIGGGRGPTALGAAPDPAASSIFTALQEQLGLRLDSQRGPVDVLAVLRAELPTEN